MKPGYSVEELVKTLANHARESKHDFEKQKKEFIVLTAWKPSALALGGNAAPLLKY